MPKLADAYVELRADDRKFRATLARSQRDMAQTYTAMQRYSVYARAFLGSIVAGVSLGSAVNLIRVSIDAAVQAERVQSRLRATLRFSRQEVEHNTNRINEYAERMKRMVNVDDDAIRQAAVLGLNMGIAATDIESATSAAIGLSEVTGQDLDSSMRLLGRTLQGNHEALDRYIPSLRGMTSAEEKLHAIEKLATQGLQSKAAQVNSTAGAYDGAKLAVEDLSKTLGTVLLPIVEKVAKEESAAIRALGAGEWEGKANLLSWQKTLLQMMPYMFSPITKQYKKAIDIYVQDIERQQNELTATVIQKDNTTTEIKLKNLDRVKEKSSLVVLHLEDIWRRQQQRVLDGYADDVKAFEAKESKKEKTERGLGLRPITEMRDREWYGRRATYLREVLKNAKDPLAFDDPKQQAWQAAFIDRVDKEYREAMRIAEFSSPMKAFLRGRIYKESKQVNAVISNRNKATQSYYTNKRDEYDQVFAESPALQRSMREKLYQMQEDEMFSNHLKNLTDAANLSARRSEYEQKIADETHKPVGGEVDILRQQITNQLQDKFGLSKSGPMKVKFDSENKLIQSLDKLTEAIPGLGVRFQ